MASTIKELVVQCKHYSLDVVRQGVENCGTRSGRQQPRKRTLGLRSPPLLALMADDLTTPLLGASNSGMPDKVAYLLECGADPTAQNSKGYSTLHLVTYMNDVASAKLLLARGGDPSAADQSGETVLHCLVYCSDSYGELLELFLDAGSDLMAAAKDGSTPLHSAAARKRPSCAEALLRRGADVHARDERGRTPLYIAATETYGCDLQLVELLLQYGSDPNARDNDGKSILELHLNLVSRKEEANTEILRLLIDHGADIGASHNPERPLLHELARNLNAPLASFDLLLERGVSINALNQFGQTALHVMCTKTAKLQLDFVELVLSRGAHHALAIEDAEGNLPLHCVVKSIPTKYGSENNVEVVRAFLNAGADVNVRNRDGLSPMSLLLHHLPNRTWRDEVADVLYVCAQVLCSYGAKWDDSCERRLERIGQLWKPLKDDGSFDEDPSATTSRNEVEDALTEQVRAAVAKWKREILKLAFMPAPQRDSKMPSPLLLISGLRSCIQFWTQERTRGGKDAKLTDIPREVFAQGEASVNTWLKDMQESTAAQRVSRSKICVVGPTEWGKTSLVKSLTQRKPSLVHLDDRTIGIDLFSCRFQEEQEPEQESNVEGPTTSTVTVTLAESLASEPKNHEVAFWDFAGQDMYQAAHALFFSKRTLYLLCVDLERYIAQLDASQQLSDRECETVMRQYVMTHVIKWVETILARQPDAEFVLVATKVDTVQDQKQIKAVWVDLQIRLGVWREEYASNAVKASANDRYAPSRQELVAKLRCTIHNQWLVVSSVDQASVERAREMTETKVVACKKGFVMGNKYSRVLRAIRDRRMAATQAQSAPSSDKHIGDGDMMRVEKLIVPSSRLIRDLCMEMEDLEPSECVVILRTLHELGDILWYEHRSAGALRDCVIVDPLLVLDIVREVISHEVNSTTKALPDQAEMTCALLREGRLTHKLLRGRPLWRHLDDELTASFKSLLQYFQLAYPARGEAMAYDSDLIVPAYWKLGEPAETSLAPASLLQVAPARPVYLAWEYVVSSAIIPTLFDQFAVQSYSPIFERTISHQTITSTENDGQFVSRIVVATHDSKSQAIRIETAASDVDSAWLKLRFFVMMMEQVLEEYGGLYVMREVVEMSSETGDETRHRVSSAVHDIETYAKLGKYATELQATRPWLPSDLLSWFIEKAWRHPGRLQEIQSRAFVRRMLDQASVLHKLVVRGEQGRLYPSLWTAQYDETEGLLSLQMLSDLSGVCYHTPIEISVPTQFWAKHGALIESGLCVFSNVIPEILTLGLVQKVIDTAVPVISGTTQRAQAVQSLIDRLDLSSQGVNTSTTTSTSTSLSPASARVLLRDLLTLHDPSFGELRVGELSHLQCAVSPSGSYVWAHPHEIKAMGGDKLTPCEPDYSAVVQAHHRQQYEKLAMTKAPKDPSEDPSEGPSNQPQVKLTLAFEGLEGVSAWDSYKVFCSWRLVHDSQAMPLAVGSTDPNGYKPSDAAATAATGAMVTWSSRTFEVSGVVTSVEMLRECRLEVQVKRASRLLGRVKDLGQSSLPLVDAVLAAAASLKPTRVEMPLEIAGSKATISCTIAVETTSDESLTPKAP